MLIFGTVVIIFGAAMAREHLQKYGWWINELESLGLSIKKTNEFNDLNEMRSLTTIYLDYKAATNFPYSMYVS